MMFELAVFFCIAAFTLTTAAVALLLRSVLHGTLLLTTSWVGIAAFYLWAGAQFAAFAQVLVYVGAVSMVALFAVVLTRRETASTGKSSGNSTIRRILPAVAAAALVAAVITSGVAIHGVEKKPIPHRETAVPALTVKEIGTHLANGFAGTLLITGLLLTVALLGAVVIAAPEPRVPTDNSAQKL
ncbi:MAG: NADH-quinone oxidoreductase subunit J [Puniceicoccales bacterium]|nr:NADH-quinone oxidoreductase subunit J [Puniceicoccales bacterium]